MKRNDDGDKIIKYNNSGEIYFTMRSNPIQYRGKFGYIRSKYGMKCET